MDSTRAVDEPRPRKRGGAMFPRITLEEAVRFAQTLRSIKYERPLPREIVFPAVFNARSWLGSVRASALKQYGLMDGNVKGYRATDLAGQILSASGKERLFFLQTACLNPRVFGGLSAAVNLFDGSVDGRRIPLSRLSEEVANLNVHVDSVRDCVKIYTDSLEFVGLAVRAANHIVVLNRMKNHDEERRRGHDLFAGGNGDRSGAKSEYPFGEHRHAQGPAPPRIKPPAATRDLAPGITINIQVDGNFRPAAVQELLQIFRANGLLR